MKVGILTFHRAVNAGAMLQAYAMQETLRHMGHDTVIIDYRPDYIESAYLPIRALDPRHPRGMAYELCSAPLRHLRREKFMKFGTKYLMLTDIKNLPELDYVILGSDQIWNSAISGGSLDAMFFNCGERFYAKGGIAYAASTLSVERIKGNDLSCFARWLPTLKAIGIREHEFASFLTEKYHLPITEVLDPTLIAPKDIYSELLDEKTSDYEYLLFYEVWHSDAVEHKAREIAKSKGLKFVGLSGSDIRMPRKDIIQIYSPADFVTLINGAKHIVTSSFHGTAFSIIFEKPFNVVCEEPHQAVRLKELLRIIRCEELLSFNSEEVTDKAPDYKKIRELLQPRIIESLDFLNTNLR